MQLSFFIEYNFKFAVNYIAMLSIGIYDIKINVKLTFLQLLLNVV